MEKLNIGTVTRVDRRFGFIKHDEDQSIFFHFNQAIENLNAGDKVLFSIRESKQKEGQIEAFAVRKIHAQPNGYNLVLGKYLRLYDGVASVLLIELPKIKLDSNQKEFAFEIAFDKVIGKSLAIKTNADDDIFFAKRFKRRGYSRFVKGGEPVDTTILTIVINYLDDHGMYEVSTTYFGPRTPPEPWDRRASENALPFWRSHALIPDKFFGIDYDTTREFDPEFFKSFGEIQAGE